ncbi:hypothetical protein AX769_11275 [Frondihabitans sp. PAMC 28766]|nr:hypothetical protein AX769_11275 [Frondihabitans sp. PAMC 28766]
MAVGLGIATVLVGVLVDLPALSLTDSEPTPVATGGHIVTLFAYPFLVPVTLAGAVIASLRGFYGRIFGLVAGLLTAASFVM